MNHPTREECEKLLSEYHTPEHVKGHCRAVADVACKIAGALNQHGYALDTELILAAGMLHDIARVEEEHGAVGAQYVRTLGYEEESRIIEVHMTYSPFPDIKDITETDLVCLGDKLVVEDAYAGLDKRIEYVVQKAIRNGHGDIEPIIRNKMRGIERFIDQIQSAIGCTIEELMKGKS